ncbi:DeoR family transcriptional regulator [Neobacillus sp. 19]|uniref:DeoR family transcriptional regulator n=1 Tax=Neobacillus sp. 19 TaxID=3394458 RepID=UPI003C2B0267
MNKHEMAERYRVIIRELEMKNKINVVDLAIKLNVTPETIRKDLSVLEEKKKLRRIHGGAIQYFGSLKELHFNKKIGIYHNQKKNDRGSCRNFYYGWGNSCSRCRINNFTYCKVN